MSGSEVSGLINALQRVSLLELAIRGLILANGRRPYESRRGRYSEWCISGSSPERSLRDATWRYQSPTNTATGVTAPAATWGRVRNRGGEPPHHDMSLYHAWGLQAPERQRTASQHNHLVSSRLRRASA